MTNCDAICTYMHLCPFMYIYTLLELYIHIYTFVTQCNYMHFCRYIHIYTCIYIYIYELLSLYTNVRTYAAICTYMHFCCSMYTYILKSVTIHAGRTHYLSFLKPLITIRIVLWFFSSPARGISHSLQIRKAQPRQWKKRTNKHTRRGSLWHSLCILWANASVYSSENSHKASCNALALIKPASVGQQVLAAAFLTSVLLSSLSCFHLLTVSFCQLVSAAPFCWLYPSLDWPLLYRLISGTFLPSSVSSFVGDLACRAFVWVSHQNRQSDSLTGTHLHTHVQWMPNFVSQIALCLYLEAIIYEGSWFDLGYFV